MVYFVLKLRSLLNLILADVVGNKRETLLRTSFVVIVVVVVVVVVVLTVVVVGVVSCSCS